MYAGRDLLSDLVRNRDRDGVGDEEVKSSEAGANKELGNLHRCEGTLDKVWYAVAESRKRVVCVL